MIYWNKKILFHLKSKILKSHRHFPLNRLLQVGYKQVEFSVEGGGCSGMNYKMTKFDRKLNDNDKVIKEGDLELVIPFSSFVYLLGTKIDFSDDLLNGGFKFKSTIELVDVEHHSQYKKKNKKNKNNT